MVLRYPGIHQYIAGAGIKTRRAAIGVQDADVADAADIYHDSAGTGCAKHGSMEGRHQWRALPASGNVTAA